MKRKRTTTKRRKRAKAPGGRERKTDREIGDMVKTYAAAHGLKKGAAKQALGTEIALAANAEAVGAAFDVLNLGMGVDSWATLLRGLTEGFETIGIDPARLLVVTAMTGNEYPELGELVEVHILPRLRAQKIRFVQVARLDSSHARNYKVLSDSRESDRVFLAGAFTILDEFFACGSIPQTASKRLCSIKSKGWPIDSFLKDELGDATFRQMIGFEANEGKRVLTDRWEGAENRRPAYPLIEWGWTRDDCSTYIKNVTGVEWVKSACVVCPYSGQGCEKKDLPARWTKYPELAGEAMILEDTARRMNHTQILFKSKAAVDFAKANGLDDAIANFEERRAAMTWAVYRVRRIWRANANANRDVKILATGTREEMAEHLRSVAAVEGADLAVDADGITRAVHSLKGEAFPNVEHRIVAAPMTMLKEKCGIDADRFEREFNEFPAGPSRPRANVVSGK